MPIDDIHQAIGILKKLADRIDPYTGKIYPADSPYENIQLAGALYMVIEFVKERLPKKARSKRVRKARLQRERKARPDRAGRAWQDKESELLVEQFDKGIGIAELAIIHQRTRGAIRARLKKLGKIET